ncbi:uncharacterized protein LOC113214503 [Frankliniella occidentalis]|uniref:Uncharacterized protein LOC113214503 n=1 Tax=Frankliniella occidentalis TaxID=133901 RepID=A0A6J1T8N7_FRAOC|nr:uncharacterized protein LOC113214503 [Frankliniella occidentalis]
MSTAPLLLAVVASLLLINLGAAAPAEQAAAAAAPAAPDQAVEAAESAATLEDEVVQTAEAGGPKKNKKRSQGTSHVGNLLAPLLETPNVYPETVSLSPQQNDPKKKSNAVQGILLNILQPKPIVDSIREEDKYGNTGDRFAFVGRGVVAGFEGFSNILNKVLDFPFETAKKVSRSATEALNNLGSRLIGL